MQTNYVREFLVMADVLNYAEAAKKLYISHSSLYKHMKALEDDLGGVLFDRDGHSLYLSRFGQVFLPHAKRIAEAEDWCMGELSRWQSDSDDSITITTDYRIADLVHRFRQRYPDYSVHNLEADSVDTSVSMLAKGTIDAALLCDEHLDEEAFTRFPFRRDYMAAVLPLNHPLAAEPVLRLEQLAEEDFVMLAPTSSHYIYCQAAFSQARVFPHIIMTCVRGDAVVENIIHGEGCSVMMGELTGAQHRGEVAIIPLEPRIEVSVDFWVGKRRRNSPVVKNFLEFMQQAV